MSKPAQKPADSKPAQKPESELVKIVVSSKGIETFSKKFTDEKGRLRSKQFVYGFVNGERFEVECDSIQEVKPEVAEALAGLIDKQNAE